MPTSSGYFGYRQQENHWRKNAILSTATTTMEHMARHGFSVWGTGKVFHNGHEDQRVWDYAGGRRYGVAPDFGPWPWDGSAPGAWTFCPHPAFLDQQELTSWEDSFGSLAAIPDYPAQPHRGAPGHRGWCLNRAPFRYVSDDDRDLLPDERNALWARDVLTQDHEHPFFLVVGMNRPHTPLYAPQRYFDRYPPESLNLPPTIADALARVPDILWRKADGTPRYGHERWLKLQKYLDGGEQAWRRWLQAYLACVSFVDDQIGAVLRALDDSGHADDTLVCVISDNGYHLGEKEWLFKDSVWDEGTRIPMLWAGPDVQAGATCTRPVSLIDCYPTWVDAVGVPSPRHPCGLGLEGHSLLPLCADATAAWAGPEHALSVVAGDVPLAINQPGKPWDQHVTLRGGRWRYTRCADGSEELYDHASDPYAWHNRAADPACTAVLTAHRAALAARLP